MNTSNRRVGKAGSGRPAEIGRRNLLTTIGTGILVGLTGCSDTSFPNADVIAGPGAQNRFEPADLTISAGETVTWGFASAGHNVSCRPEDHPDVVLPDNAEPFSSYGPDESPSGSLVPRGGTYRHTFDVPGTFRYVCIPHASVGMQGTIRVE